MTLHEQKGGKTIEKILPFDQAKLEEDLMNLPITDFSEEEGKIVAQTDVVHFVEVKKALESLGYHILEADLQYIADNTISLDGEDAQKFSKFLDTIESDEDVDMVWHNVELN